MKAVGMEEVETYVLHRNNTVTQYNATRPILEICMSAERWPGAQVSLRWWEQAGLEPGQGGSEMDAETETETETETEEERRVGDEKVRRELGRELGP